MTEAERPRPAEERDDEHAAGGGPAAPDPVHWPEDATRDGSHLEDPGSIVDPSGDAGAGDATAADDATTAEDAMTADDAEERHEVDLSALAEADPRSKAELLAELGEAESRRDEYLDDVRRARAEFENYRKRIMREGATQRELGKAAVLESLLEVLDDLDRTLEAAGASHDQKLARGIELAAAKLVQALQANGLERIDAVEVPFDPTLHEAVQQREADEPSGEPVVAKVLRPGYRHGDRVLRAAMVVVEQ